MDRRTFISASASGVLLGGTVSAAAPAFPTPIRDPNEPTEAFEMLIGAGLIRLFWKANWPAMRDRIGLLRSLLVEGGIVMPKIRIRDFLKLADEDYLLLVRGEVVEHGTFAVREEGAAQTRSRILERMQAIARRQNEWIV